MQSKTVAQGRAEELSSRSVQMFLFLLSTVAYVSLTRAAMKDAELLAAAPTRLPLLGVAVPSSLFLWVTPPFLVVCHAILLALISAAHAYNVTGFPWYVGASKDSEKLLRWGALLGVSLLVPFVLGVFFFLDFWLKNLFTQGILCLLCCGDLWVVVIFLQKCKVGVGWRNVSLKTAGILTILLVFSAMCTPYGILTIFNARVPALPDLAGTQLSAVPPGWHRTDDPSLSLVHPANLSRIIGGNRPIELHANGAFLSKVDLQGRDLTRSSFQGSTLEISNLAGATLDEAHLERANLTRADLTRSHLRNAHLVAAVLVDADLTDADLTNADLTDANLERATLTRATLSGAKLLRAKLRGARLTELDAKKLAPSKSARTNFTDADLTDANLRGIHLEDTTATNITITGARVSGANLCNAVIQSEGDPPCGDRSTRSPIHLKCCPSEFRADLEDSTTTEPECFAEDCPR